MFKNRRDDEVKSSMDKWFTIIHNDLVGLHMDNQEKSKTKREKEIYNQLKGLRNSLMLDACSGVGYIHEGTFYNSLEDLADKTNIESYEEDLPSVDRVISVDYLLHFIDQILEK